ncbi:MAG: SGNH/GDSL hydrolase family protein [Clostridia bacterium]|nr:SGNH/GDSL hydrolase family protein [Clostridia bacterium]
MSNTDDYYRINDLNEKPLAHLVSDGGYCGILRTIGCVGDSLSSGEFESRNENGDVGYHDQFDYSWGQFLARDCGNTVYNFSRGGMTAKEYVESFAEQNGFWVDQYVCQAYILALGVNDLNAGQPIGSTADIDLTDRTNNKPTFAGYYGAIIQRLREKQDKARFFFVTMPKTENGSVFPAHTKLMYDMAALFPHSYVIDLDRDAPPHDAAFRDAFYMGGHMNAAGYRLTAKQIETYIDFIIRHNMDDFRQIGFVGTPYHNAGYSW